MRIVELEALRGFAAFYIFLHHTFTKYIPCNIYFSKLFIFGQEAVMLFFLLSGYVIALSQFKNNYQFNIYFLHRFLRIYSVVIPAILFSYIIYSHIHESWIVDIKQLILNLSMMQDKPELKPGVIVGPIFHNEPLWSLSYEWWFYMIFFVHYKIIIFFKSQTKLYILSSFFISLVGIISYKYFYNQVSLFLIYYFIWASGASLYLIHKNDDIQKKSCYFKILIACYFFLTAIYFYIFVYNESISHLINHPILELRHYLSAIILIIMSQVYKKYLNFDVSNFKLIKIFTKFASISFAFYVIHYPVMLFFDSLDVNGFLKILIMFIVSVIISWIIEISFFKNYIRKNLIGNK
ncbi:MAG: acyltransferase [Sulfurovum sp.]|nr:acyltransferase [Sulfurovum sp.]